MSERRPHWDDYLLASVMIHCSDIYQCHAVIAAVEDWHLDRWTGVCESPEEVVRELKQAQAAIQRVQAVCDKPNPGPSWDSYVEGYNDAISVVQAAMEGDADA
jgi:preprotein translocase subunit Sss1